MKKMKINISFEATDEYIQSDDFKELKEAVESGEFKKTIEEADGVENVEVKMEESEDE